MNIIIIGAGKLGLGIVRMLSSKNHNITVIDVDQQRVERAIESFDIAGVCGNGTNCDILSEAGVKSAYLVIAATFSDEVNILSCLMARRMGARHTIARVRDPQYFDQTDFMRKQLGISMMVNPDYDCAFEISRIIQLPSAISIETFADGRVDIAQFLIREDSPFCSKKISELANELRHRLIVCAVCRGDKVFIPNGDFELMPGDRIHIAGEHNQIIRLSKFFSETKHGKTIKSVMIVGGSRISVYLANLLSTMGKQVTIIEKDEGVCNSLSELASEAKVINCDANDNDALIENGLDCTDAIVTLTDTDETNYIISLFAKNVGVPVSVTKINNASLSKMITGINPETTVSVTDIAANRITQYIRSKNGVAASKIKNLYKLVEGAVEAAEFEVTENFGYLGVPLCEMKIKKGILVAVIMRNNRIIFPGGNDCIENGDTVVVISEGVTLASLNDIID